MQFTFPGRRCSLWRYLALAVPTVALAVLFRGPLLQALGLAAGGGVLAFLLYPLEKRLEGWLSRPLASLMTLMIAVVALAGLLWLCLPTLLREIAQLAETLPRSIALLTRWAQSISERIARWLPGAALPAFPAERLTALASNLAAGTLAFAGGLAGALSRLSMMGILAYCFLCDRQNLLLRLELLIPRSARRTAVRMANAVARELRLYLGGQLLVALAVGALTAAGLLIIGVRSALVLGGIVGILNMVPYFGPFIGGVPAVLIALGGGWQRALLCLGVLALVQQLDSAVISPRIMGSLTGFSPAAILLTIYAGAGFGGIGGMLLALPVMMSVRTVFRVFVQQRENN